MAAMANRNKDDYQYTKLCEIKEEVRKLNLYGIVVNIVKQSSLTPKGKYHSICDIVDETVTYDDAFRMHLFMESSDISSQIELGCILRAHRVQVENFNCRLDGRIQSARDLVVFPKIDAPEKNFFTAAKSITFTDHDKKRLADLQEIRQLTCIFGDPFAESSDCEKPTSKDKESDAFHPQMEPCVNGDELDESLLEETEDQRLTFKMKKSSPKRKEPPVSNNYIPTKTPKSSSDRRKSQESASRNELTKGTMSDGTGNSSNERAEVDHTAAAEIVETVNEPDVTKLPTTVTTRKNAKCSPSISQEEKLEGYNNCTSKISNRLEEEDMVEKPTKASSSPEADSAIFLSLPHVIARTNLKELSGVTKRKLNGDNFIHSLDGRLLTDQGFQAKNKSPNKKVIDEPTHHCPRNPQKSSLQKTLSPSTNGLNLAPNDHQSTPLSSSKWLSNDKSKICVFKRRSTKTKEANVQVMSLVKKHVNCSTNQAALQGKQPGYMQSDGENESDDDHTQDLLCCNAEPTSNPASVIENQGESELCSASSLAAKMRANSYVSNSNGNDCKPADIEGSSTSVQDCPGLACVGNDCVWPAPVLLEENDPRLANFVEEELITDGTGNIPAVLEDGTIVCRSRDYMPYGDISKLTQIDAGSLLSFKWPRYLSKIKIVKIKPSLKVLQTSGPKNLVSGGCAHCGAYIPYSHLEWYRDLQNGTKKPMCPDCAKDGKRHFVKLDFRIKLIARDAWGTDLPMYAVRRHASKFLDCSLKEYQENEDCRSRVMKRLSEAISSQFRFNTCIFRVNTLIRPQFYICDTILPEV